MVEKVWIRKLSSKLAILMGLVVKGIQNIYRPPHINGSSEIVDKWLKWSGSDYLFFWDNFTRELWEWKSFHLIEIIIGSEGQV